ncbi:hypothetical protein ACSBR2_027509 [Camellia fascicularis]
MKGFFCIAVVLLIVLFVPAVMSARHIAWQSSHHGHHHHATMPSNGGGLKVKVKPNVNVERGTMKHRIADTLQIAGSSLPDCSHACGSCSPCRLVIVSFVCASLAEAETCPMAYKCMCNKKSYPVP